VGTLTFTLTDCDGRIDGNAVLAGNVEKRGAGTLRLNGAANSYSGTTNVFAGALLVNGGLTSSDSAATATGHLGGTLGGAGTIGSTAGARDVLVETGGILAPGDANPTTCGSLPGRLTVNGDVTFQAGAIYHVQLHGLAAGTQYDQVRLNGTLDLTAGYAATGGPTLELLDGFPIPLGADFRIIDNDGAERINTRPLTRARQFQAFETGARRG